MEREEMGTVALTIRSGDSVQTFSVEKGRSLVSIAAEHDTALTLLCCRAACGECLVRVSKHPENLSECGPEERKLLSVLDAVPDSRLACQCTLLGDVQIEL